MNVPILRLIQAVNKLDVDHLITLAKLVRTLYPEEYKVATTTLNARYNYTLFPEHQDRGYQVDGLLRRMEEPKDEEYDIDESNMLYRDE